MICALLAAALVAVGGTAVAVKGPGTGQFKAAKWPAHIDLPDGWQPEGIASGKGHELFVGSIPTGDVRRIDARTGEQTTVVDAPDGRNAIGLKADHRRRLFVAGGPTGMAFVYDARTGAALADFQLAPAGEDTFVNDVALTKRAAYFTEFRRAVIYVVDTDLSGARELPLNGLPTVGNNNLNGIVAARNGKWLLTVQSSTGFLWRVDPETGDATKVDLGTNLLTNGDGLLLVGKTLYVVQNFLNQIGVYRLAPDFASGELVRTITSGDFDIPTTIARHGKRLYAVNARFGTTDPQPARYWLTQVRR
jgi:sugar lactone lactonase YvrE